MSAVPGNGDQGLDWAAGMSDPLMIRLFSLMHLGTDAAQSSDWTAPDPANKEFTEVTSGPPQHPTTAGSGWD